MLSHDDIARVRSAFSVFDHEWTFYSASRGEPYLIDECLVYFDGVFLYVCAFQLADPWQELSGARLAAILSGKPEFETAQAVCLWGRYATIDAVGLEDGRHLDRVAFKDYDPSFVDAVVDVATFDLATQRPARLAANAVSRSELSVDVVQQKSLSAAHLALIAEWSNTHDVSDRSAGVLAGLPLHVREEHVHLVECRYEGELVGFTVLALQGRSAVYVQGFSRRVAKLRIGDALYVAMVDFAKARDAHRLHLGYSPTPELARFKQKWGAELSGPPFRDAMFTKSTTLAALFDSGRFRWHERLTSPDPIPVAWPGEQAEGQNPSS